MAHYFGESARDVFFDQFHHLAKHRLIEGNASNKLTRKALREKDSAKKNTGTGSISRIALQPKSTYELDFPFAPKRPSTANAALPGVSIASLFGNQSSFLFDEGTNQPSSIEGHHASVLTSFYDQTSKNDTTQQGSDSLSSPRTTYLEGCLNGGLKPRASLILRKNVTTEVNLKHNSMGDKMAVIFAKALRDLPLITTLNLCDNALTDEGASALLDAVMHLPNITSLDISMNKIDGNAADSLADYLKAKTCPLKILTLTGADIDDSECDRFITALRYNTTMTELDMSNNKIGVSETLNVVKPDFRTGSEALATFLMKSDCSLETLKLHWNMIRLDGAVTFANSLRFNSSLTDLDISYNSFARHGGEALGDALVENKTLRTLNVCGNSFNATACFTICVGIEENFVIRNVVLDNNSIGVQGAKALLELPSTVGNRVRVSAERCNISLVENDFKFNRNDPGGVHTLHLENAFERAVAFKILQIIAHNSSFDVTARYEAPATNLRIGGGVKKHVRGNGDIKLVRGYSDHKVKLMDREQSDLMSRLKRVARAALDMNAAVQLFNEFDEDGSGSIDPEELYKLLHKLGVDVDDKVVSIAMATYDLDGEGALEMNEFLQFLRSQHDEAISRLREMAECPIMCLANKPTERYIPPRRGILHLTVKDSFQSSGTQKVLTTFDCNNIVKMIKNSKLDITDGLVMAIKNVKLRTEEARAIYKHLHAECRDKSKALALLLPQMLNAKEARSVVDEIIGDDDLEMNKLKSMIGSAIKPILGYYDGYYDLDMARETDRVCMMQLLERSQDVMEKRKKQYEATFGYGMVGDCSQKQNWSAFRNERFNDTDFIITPAMFTPFPTAGKLSFDFLASDHPDESSTSLSDKRCISCLISLGLMTEDNRSRAQDALNAWREYGIATSDGKGREMPIADYARAYAIQQFSNKFHNSLKERADQLSAAARREDIVAFRNRQAKLAAKRGSYKAHHRASSFMTSRRKSSKSMLSPAGRKSSRTSIQRMNSSSNMLASSIKEFQELAMPDLASLGDSEEANDSDNDDTSDDDDDEVSPRSSSSHIGPPGRPPRNRTSLSITLSKSRGNSVDNSPLVSARKSIASTPRSAAGQDNSVKGDMPRRLNTYIAEEDDADDMDYDLFSPKRTAKVNMRTGNTFSFDFLESKQPSRDSKDNSDSGVNFEDSIGKANTFDSRPPSLDDDDDDEDAKGGLISGLRTLSKLNTRLPSRITGSNSFTPKDGPKKDPDDRIAAPSLIRKTSSLSIAMQYLQESMQVVAAQARQIHAAQELSMPIRANIIVTALEKIFSKAWISARHLALILNYFAIGKEKKTANFGTYRVEVFVSLFSRVVDPQNLDSAIKTLTSYEAACVYCRVGWLNIFNPLKPDGCHVLDLSYSDERTVIKVLALLSAVEPGENIRASRFRWKFEDDDLAGWVLLAPWVSEEHMPHRGVMYLDYYSGEGEGLRSCLANVPFRKSLSALVYSNEVVVVEEEVEGGESEPCSPIEKARRGSIVSSSDSVGMRYASMHMDVWKKVLLPRRGVMGTRTVAVTS